MIPQSFILATYYLLVEITAYSTTQIDQVVHGNNIQPLFVEKECGPWHYHKQIDGECQCYQRDGVPVDWIRCTDESALLLFGNCMTYEEGEGTFVSECPYFQAQGHKVSDSEPGYIELPNNISELNDYMCRPMNRKGHLCRECIDGFGPSFTSFGYECSNCTNSFGIPLFVLIEFVPLTVLYLIILVFQVNLTTSPMTCFIYYSQLLISATNIGPNSELSKLIFEAKGFRPIFALLPVYGMWNLDFFRYAVSPFCISSKLTIIHIILIGYMSVIYPLCLIVITWICVEVHGRNFRPLVWLWRPFHRCFVKLRREWDTKSDIIDVFCTFLLLSYNKLVFQSLNLVWCQTLLKASNSGNLQSTTVARFDSHLTCGHNKSILLDVLVGVILFVSILPTLLLILYPIKCFRTCLSRRRLDLTATNMFVEKFHSCYRDGLDGGRDMRSCSGFYFLLRFAPLAGMVMYETLHISLWSIISAMYTVCAISIALIKPYKKNYMNISDTLLLSLIAILCHLITSDGKIPLGPYKFVIVFLPALVFWIYVISKLVTKVWYITMKLCIKDNCNEIEGNEHHQPLIQSSSVTCTVVGLSSP